MERISGVQAKVVVMISAGEGVEGFLSSLVAGVGGGVVVADAHIDDAHVGGQEVNQAIGTGAGQAIEGVAHGLAIGVAAIAHATVAGSIAAASH